MSNGVGTGWWTYIRYNQERDRPKISWALLRRVWGYAKPYQLKVLGLVTTILAITGLSLIPPLLYRDLIDNAIMNADTSRLNWLALGMIGIPILSAAIGFGQRYLSATIGEGLIADLRNALFNHMQQMSLRFFTHTKTGELMSRLNNDVVGAQNALTGTFINIVTNIVTVVATLTMMFSLEWRLTLLSIAVVPLFVAPTRRVGRKLRKIRRRSMELNARMNTLMQETLNIDGALLVKLFGRQADERDRFRRRSKAVADTGMARMKKSVSSMDGVAASSRGSTWIVSNSTKRSMRPGSASLVPSRSKSRLVADVVRPWRPLTAPTPATSVTSMKPPFWSLRKRMFGAAWLTT